MRNRMERSRKIVNVLREAMTPQHHPVMTAQSQVNQAQATATLTSAGSASSTRQQGRPFSGRDLFSTLPAELRNEIYRHLLIGAAIEIRKHRLSKGLDAKLNKPKIWREPPILRASKYIRAEAIALYYASNPTTIYLSPPDFPRACDWIASIARACDGESRVFKSFQFRVTNPRWEELTPLYSLAHLYHAHRNLELHSFPQPFVKNRNSRLHPPDYRHPSTQRKESIFCIAPETCVYFQDALEEVVALGRQAREQGWTETQLTLKLNAWKAEKSTSPHFRGLRRARERVAEARDFRRRQAKWEAEEAVRRAEKAAAAQRAQRAQQQARRAALAQARRSAQAGQDRMLLPHQGQRTHNGFGTMRWPWV